MIPARTVEEMTPTMPADPPDGVVDPNHIIQGITEVEDLGAGGTRRACPP